MHRIAANGLELAVWEWGGEGPAILLVHATGFHGRCWDAVARRLPGRRIFALDQASHGASARRVPPYAAAGFGADVARVAQTLGLRDALGVGHSMGGHAMVVAASQTHGVFGSLLLLDPVIVDPEPATELFPLVSAADHPVARRRNRWASVEQMVESFSRRPPYSRWDSEVLLDYCRHGLRRDASGQFELACPPELEVEVYIGIHMRTIYRDIADVKIPVDIVRARDRRPDDAPFDFSPSPTWRSLAGRFSDGRDEHLPEDTHFFPMEAPAWTAGRIASFADAPRS